MRLKTVIPSRWRTVAVLAIGVAIGTTMVATPAAGHITSSVTHVRDHMKQYFFTKGQSDNRYVRKGGAAGGDLSGTYPNPVIADGAVTSAKLAPREAVQSPTLLACDGGTNWDSPAALAQEVGFWKDRSGVVHLQGSINCAGNASEGGAIFNLPAGYRPAFNDGVVRWAALAGGVSIAQIAVLDDGSGAVVYDGPDNTAADNYISLDGLTFRAEE